MFVLIVSLMAVLFVCDIVLVTYCRVKNGFRMFAFRIFTILLAVMSLMMTGDIVIASGG